MELYSYKNQEPTPLPFSVILDDGSLRTSLSELSLEELENIGFVGPIIEPEYDEDTQKIEWNGVEYEILLLSTNEILQREREERERLIKNINYNAFWNRLILSKIYNRLRISSLQSLEANTLCTELISLFSDAKSGNPDTTTIQKYINILFLNFEYRQEEVEELQMLLDDTNLSILYTLPTSEFLSSHVYDVVTNEIVTSSPFNSWILVNGKWTPPIDYPTDGKAYNWDENLLNWVESVN